MKICLSRKGAEVVVVGDEDTLSWVLMRTACGFDSVSEVADNAWHVYAGREFAPTANWTGFRRHYASGEVCEFLVDSSRKLIVIDLQAGPWLWLYTLRMIRNVLRWELFKFGAIYLHASCVSWECDGLAFLGPSRSGKSSLMVSALRQGWNYVTEDDLTLLDQGNGKILALGWPGSLRIRRSMLHLYPEIENVVDQLTHPANALEALCDPDSAMVRVFPEELAQIFGCEIVPETEMRVAAVVSWDSCVNSRILPESDLAEALNLAWDILPERKAGVRGTLADAIDLRSRVFDTFLLDHYGVDDIAGRRLAVEQFGRKISGLAIAHSGVMVDRIG